MKKESIFIPGNVPSSKNSRQWTGKYSIVSKTTQRYRKATKEYWKKFRETFINNLPPEKPYIVEFKFIRGNKHKFDYPNPLQTVLDEMVRYGWIEDDNADVILPVFLPYEYNKDKPGVIISIQNYVHDRSRNKSSDKEEVY
jgi:hypothetical protein